jgi:hypothetical protein
MTTYELFLCWIIIALLVLVVGEASIINPHSPDDGLISATVTPIQI